MAAAAQRDEIAVLDQLEQTDSVRSERAAPLTDLADALTDSGDYAGARRASEQGLEIVKAMGDERTEGVVLGQLGTLAMREGRLGEAEGRYREALAIKETLDPGAAEIWSTHEIIADIAEREADAATDPAEHAARCADARDQRRRARAALLAFPGNRQRIAEHLPLIRAVAAAAGPAEPSPTPPPSTSPEPHAWVRRLQPASGCAGFPAGGPS